VFILSVVAGSCWLAGNDQGLLLCRYFLLSGQEPMPVKKLMMKITKADKIPSAGYGLIRYEADFFVFYTVHVICRLILSRSIL
jgi:hypothetical protein